MAYTPQAFGFVPRAGIDVDSYSGEVAGCCFCCYADAVGEGCDLFGGAWVEWWV